MAHIVAASSRGPRGDSGIDNEARAHSDNLILLDPTCHAVIDSAPDEFPVELLLKWKVDRRDALINLLGVPHCRTRQEAREVIRPLLMQNSVIFGKYGPFAPGADAPDSEIGHIWKRKVAESIIPNNRRLLAVIEASRSLANLEELKVLEEFRQHVDDFESRHLRGKVEPDATRFPSEIDEIFADC